MTTQTTTSTTNQNVKTQSQNKTSANFNTQFSAELFDAQGKAGRPQNTEQDAALTKFNKQFCNKKADACIAEARACLIKLNERTANYWFAQAYVWADIAGIDIAPRVKLARSPRSLNPAGVFGSLCC